MQNYEKQLILFKSDQNFFLSEKTVTVLFTTGLCFFGLSWCNANHYAPWTSFHSETLALISVTLFSLSILAARLKEHRCSALIVFVQIIALFPWIQLVFDILHFCGSALLSFIYLSALAWAILIGINLDKISSGRQLLALMHTLWVAAMLSAMIGLIQWLKLEDFLGIYIVQTAPGSPAAGNLAQPNQLATLLLMGVLAFTYIFERRIIGPVVFALGICFMTFVLVLTHSRSGMLGVIVAGGFLIVKKTQINSRLSRFHILFWIGLFGLMTFLSPYLDQLLLLSSDREVLFSGNGRLLIWKQIMHGIAQSPWLGYGWNQTTAAHMAGAADYPGELSVIYAHNVLLDILAWCGVPLGLGLIGLGGYWFFTRIYHVAGLHAGYAMACLLPFTVHSLVEFPFAYAYFLVTAGLMMGVVEASMPGTRVWRISKLWLGSALLVWSSIGAYIVYEYFLIEEDFRIVRFENLRVGTTDAAYQVPNVWMLSHMGTMLKVARQPAVPGMTEQQLGDLRRVSMTFSYGTLNLRYALALGLNGDPIGAQQAMAVVRGVHGKKFYAAAKLAWAESADKYPQLKEIKLP